MKKDQSRVRPVTVRRLARLRRQARHLQVRHRIVGDRIGTNMMFAILGMLMAILEAYVWLFRPNSHASPNPITIGLPLLIAAGILKRPTKERAAILTFAAILAVSLNRALIAQQMLVRVTVFAGAAYLTWWGHRTGDVNQATFKRLAVVAGATLGGFVIVWLWQLL
jgi:hypothetical protein